MARKKKRWRELDDPAEIFGSERMEPACEEFQDPAFDAFRRHIEEQVEGETRAFHELRSTAEHELQAAMNTAPAPARSVPPPRKNPAPEPRKPAAQPPPAVMQNVARRPAKSGSITTQVILGLIFTSIGFLLHTAVEQAQPSKTKAAAVKANCGNEKAVTSRKTNAHATRSVAAVRPPAPVTPPPAPPVTPAPAAAPEVSPVQESSLIGLTLRAVELRKGPGSSFEIVDSLPPGFALEGVLTTDKQWLRVRPGAFVSVEAVQFQDSSAAGYQNYWIGPHVANIREFPQITAKVLRKAEPGSEIRLQLFNAEWAQVAGGGFVFRKLVTQEEPKLLQLPALMRVTVEKAEIRGGPGPQYPVLGLYFRNHKVEVQEVQSGWLRVGPEQYIRAQELELAVKPSAAQTM